MTDTTPPGATPSPAVTLDSATETGTDTSGSQQPERKPRHGLLLVVLALAQLMVTLDGTIVNVALPTAQQALGFDTDQRQWVITAYALAFGSLLLLGGRVADLLGRKRAFIIGLVGFAVASAIAGASIDLPMLIAGRALQGLFGALLAPAALSLVSTTFTEAKERARAFGVYGAVAGAGGAIGLLLGGVLTQYTSWRWCLYVNLVIAAITITGAALLIPRQAAASPRPRLDIPGTVLIVAALSGIVYGFSSAAGAGWSAWQTVVPLGAGAVLIVAFVILERTAAHPLLPLRVVLDRDRGSAYLTLALVGATLFSTFLFLTYYLQIVRGYSPVGAGVAFLPIPISIIISAALLAPRLLQRYGSKTVIVIGTLLGVAAMLVLTSTTTTSGYWITVAPGLALLGLGIGNVIGASINLATAGVDPGDAGVASALVNTTQQVGGAIGTALLATIAASSTVAYLHQHGTTPLDQLMAQVTSDHIAFLTSAGILLIVTIAALLLIRSHRPATPATETQRDAH